MLVRLVDDEATAIVPVARNSAVTTGENNWQKEISENTVASKTRLQALLSLMSKLTSARVPLRAGLINNFSQVSYCEHSSKTQKLLTVRKTLNELRPFDSRFECKYFSKDLKVKCLQV